MALKRWQKVMAAVAGTFLLLIAIGYHLFAISSIEHYSRDRYSGSSEEARANGLLFSKPVISTPTVALGDATYRVQDAWIEQVSHVEYEFKLFKRVVKDNRYRLVVRIDSTEGTAISNWLEYNPGQKFDTKVSRGYWLAHVETPFPDTLRLAEAQP